MDTNRVRSMIAGASMLTALLGYQAMPNSPAAVVAGTCCTGDPGGYDGCWDSDAGKCRSNGEHNGAGQSCSVGCGWFSCDCGWTTILPG